jgi:hypothetical protein
VAMTARGARGVQAKFVGPYHGDVPRGGWWWPFDSTWGMWGVQAKFVGAYVKAALLLKAKKDDLHLLPGYSLSEDAGLLQDLANRALAEAAENGTEEGTAANLASLVRMTSESGVEEAARQLQQAAQDYMVMSHLVWGLWGLIQLKVSDVAEFDFYGYAVQRLQQYRAMKERLLGA